MPRIEGWLTDGPPHALPTAEAAIDRIACGGEQQEGKHHRSRLILSRRLPEKDAADARAKVRRPADGERLDVEWSLLKPGGVVGDEDERAETDLVALSQSTVRNHDDGNRKNRNFTKKALTHLPTVGANCRGSKTDSRMGG